MHDKNYIKIQHCLLQLQRELPQILFLRHSAVTFCVVRLVGSYSPVKRLANIAIDIEQIQAKPPHYTHHERQLLWTPLLVPGSCENQWRIQQLTPLSPPYPQFHAVKRPLKYSYGNLGERCKLPPAGRGRARSSNTFYSILSQKSFLVVTICHTYDNVSWNSYHTDVHITVKCQFSKLVTSGIFHVQKISVCLWGIHHPLIPLWIQWRRNYGDRGYIVPPSSGLVPPVSPKSKTWLMSKF